jgi:protein-tyrosine phosphatase
MIDLSCHILDGMGCGPESYAESLEMCRTAIKGGVRTVVATPLWRAGSVEPPLSFDEMSSRIERMSTELRGALSIRTGFVFEFSTAIPELAERYGTRVTLGGKRHLMISLPSTSVPANTNEVWVALARMGYAVLVAHPECSAALRRKPALLSEWAVQGVKFQFGAASVLGTYGREVRRFTVECLRKFDGKTVVASNAHTAQTNLMGKARAELVSELGERQALKHLREVPKEIIDDVEVSLERKPTLTGGLNALFRVLRPLPANQKEV